MKFIRKLELVSEACQNERVRKQEELEAIEDQERRRAAEIHCEPGAFGALFPSDLIDLRRPGRWRD